MRPKAGEDFDQRMPLTLNAQNVAQLAGRNQNTRRGDEARDYRMRQEIGQKAQPKQPQRQQHRTGQKCQR